MRTAGALLVLGVSTLMGQDSPQPPGWRIWIQRGTEEFRNARYSEAISAFQKASDSNPENPVPRIYLGLGWLQQYIPGAVSTENTDRARRAETELRRALDLDPMSWIANVVLGQLGLNENRLEEARQRSHFSKRRFPILRNPSRSILFKRTPCNT
jgi:tetratricopeptide (TPR) repeat protein